MTKYELALKAFDLANKHDSNINKILEYAEKIYQFIVTHSEKSEKSNELSHDEKMKISVQTIPFTGRVLGMFQNENIKTIGDIMTLGERYLLKIPNFGKASVREIKQWLWKTHKIVLKK